MQLVIQFFDNEFTNWCQNGFTCSNSNNPEIYTYVSDVHCSTSWLDHIMCSADMDSLLMNVKTLDKRPCSDHLPIAAAFNINISSNAELNSRNRKHNVNNENSNVLCQLAEG